VYGAIGGRCQAAVGKVEAKDGRRGTQPSDAQPHRHVGGAVHRRTEVGEGLGWGGEGKKLGTPHHGHCEPPRKNFNNQPIKQGGEATTTKAGDRKNSAHHTRVMCRGEEAGARGKF